jgi:hypothetical protein
MITWNTKQIPGIIGEIENEDGRTILIQNDWDYPAIASTFEWSARFVQCERCRCGGMIDRSVSTGLRQLRYEISVAR